MLEDGEGLWERLGRRPARPRALSGALLHAARRGPNLAPTLPGFASFALDRNADMRLGRTLAGPGPRRRIYGAKHAPHTSQEARAVLWQRSEPRLMDSKPRLRV